jgi:hypothetical protein
MTAHLALRKTPPLGFLPKAFFYLTKARLLTRYPHGGVVIDDTLYHVTGANGVHSMPFDPAGWDLFVTDADPVEILNRFLLVKGKKYDWVSLFTFVSSFRITVSNRWYCYELCHYFLTGKETNQRVTPEDLLAGVLHARAGN